MTRNTTSKGDLSELEIALALVRSGYSILRPMSTGLRYDLAIDNRDGTFSRIQCKSGILRDGFIEFNVSSADARRPNGVPYIGQIEAFGVFCPQNGKVYLVPIDRIGARLEGAAARRRREEWTSPRDHARSALRSGLEIGRYRRERSAAPLPPDIG